MENIKDIIKTVETKLDETKSAIENKVENLIGKKHFHAEVFWGVLAGIVIVGIIGIIAFFVWQSQIETMISSQMEVIIEKISELKK